MKIVSIALMLFWSSALYAQNFDFKIMSWNIEWFGDPNNCGCDTSLQRQNVRDMLAIEKPDILALQEIVDIDLLRSIADADGYEMIVSPYGSLASDTQSGNYARAQKLAFLFRKGSHINLITSYGLARSTYPFLSNNNSPYYYFASGRFPFLATFELRDGSDSDTITLVNIHGKAGSSTADYTRRRNGAEVIQDSLDAQFSDANVLVLGDFNDLLGGSILSGTAFSPYRYNILAGYIPLTHPDSLPGQTTYVYRNSSIIDNFLANSSFANSVKSSSVEVVDRVAQYIINYSTTTSDHYPIMLTYTSPVRNTLSSDWPTFDQIQVYPNPTNDKINVEFGKLFTGQIVLYTIDGKVLSRQDISEYRHDVSVQNIADQTIILTVWAEGELLFSDLVSLF